MRFGDENPYDGQFNPQNAWVEPYVGPPVSCEVCRYRSGLERRGEVLIVTNAEEGLSIVACAACATAGNVQALVAVSENREIRR